MQNIIYTLAIALALFLAACNKQAVEHQYPQTQGEKRAERAGSLTGSEEGGITLFSSDKSSKHVTGSALAVNNYLWRAALEIISFMPIATSDSQGGVITTTWYEDPAVPNERFKLNVLILGGELRTDALKVIVFKQKFDKKREWVDVEVSPKVARALEDQILTQARKLRISQEIK